MRTNLAFYNERIYSDKPLKGKVTKQYLKNQFNRLCMRVAMNSDCGYVITPEKEVFKINIHESRLAKLVLGEEREKILSHTLLQEYMKVDNSPMIG